VGEASASELNPEPPKYQITRIKIPIYRAMCVQVVRRWIFCAFIFCAPRHDGVAPF
jgi:hypothetical protein